MDRKAGTYARHTQSHQEPEEEVRQPKGARRYYSKAQT